MVPLARPYAGRSGGASPDHPAFVVGCQLAEACLGKRGDRQGRFVRLQSREQQRKVAPPQLGGIVTGNVGHRAQHHDHYAEIGGFDLGAHRATALSAPDELADRPDEAVVYLLHALGVVDAKQHFAQPAVHGLRFERGLQKADQCLPWILDG